MLSSVRDNLWWWRRESNQRVWNHMESYFGVLGKRHPHAKNLRQKGSLITLLSNGTMCQHCQQPLYICSVSYRSETHFITHIVLLSLFLVARGKINPKKAREWGRKKNTFLSTFWLYWKWDYPETILQVYTELYASTISKRGEGLVTNNSSCSWDITEVSYVRIFLNVKPLIG